MNYRNVRIGLFTAGLLIGSAAHVSAQATTYRACFVPQVGAMYLLDLPGLPTACLSVEHQEITWSDGAAPLAGSVDTDALADDAVTGAKIANGSVGILDIGTNAVGRLEIETDGVASAEIAANAVGASEIAAGAVGASEIATGAVGASEIATGAVGSAQIATGAVGESELDISYQQRSYVTRITANSTQTVTMDCAGSEEVLGGGYSLGSGLTVRASFPSGSGTWAVTAQNSTGSLVPIVIYTICADISG
jgi:hypothetical protein